MTTGTAPRVSVLLPSGEGAPRPLDAVASCLAQPGVEVEILLLHDGSAPDAVASVVQQDPERVRILAHPAHGVARALSLGAAVARGQWVVALSSHERWRPGALASQVGLAEAAPGTVGVLCPAAGAPGEDLVGALFEPVPPPGGGALLRTEAVRAVGGYDPSLRFAHHLDLWLRLLGHGKLVLGSSAAVDEPSRARRTGEIEPEASRRERALVLSQALSRSRPAAWVDGDPAPGEAEIRLARTVARAGLIELRPHAVELLAAARAAGVTIDAATDPDFAGLVPDAPALTRLPRAPSPQVAARRGDTIEPWLRVALEVQSLDRGGLENVVADLALGFADVGVEPIILCTERGGARAAELRSTGVDVVVLGSGDRARELGQLLDERRVDLLNPHFSWIGIRPAAERGIPVVPTLHNAYAWVGASVLDDFRSLDPLVSGYTAVSRFVADFSAARFDIASARICVIPNAYRAGGVGRAIDRATARRELGVADDVQLVLQVGRIDPVKCQLALVDAVDHLRGARPRVRAWMAGGIGDASYAARVKERIERNEVGEVVELLGQRDDVDRLLAAADVLAMPSVVEGLSLSIIEALAAGVPAVLTRTGDAGMLLGDGTDDALPGALIDGPEIDPLRAEGEDLLRVASADHPTHALALAEALGTVLDDLPAMRDRARRRGEALATQFAPNQILSQYADVFGRTVATCGRDAARRTLLASESARREEAVAVDATAQLRAAVAAASDGLDATLALTREREGAVRQAGALAYELSAMRTEVESTVRTTDQLLNKLRVTHRVRAAVASMRRRVLGG